MYPQLTLFITMAPLAMSAIIPRGDQMAEIVEHSDLTNVYHQAACSNMHNISMDAGSLPQPSSGLRLYHIAIGRGTQNYSCPAAAGPSAAPIPNGAVATLYNATCLTGLFGTAITNELTNFVAKQSHNAGPLSLYQSGNHYFPDFSTPTFNLKTKNADYGIDFAKKANSTIAPATASTSQDGSKAVPWLLLKVERPPISPYSLSAADTNSVVEIYRINTAGGSAPPTCANHIGSNFTQQYAAEYWFWSS